LGSENSLFPLSGRAKRILLIAASLAFFGSGSAHAASTTWTGSGGNGLWLTPTNWSSNTPSDIGVFGSSGGGTVTVNGGVQLNALTFTEDAAAFTIAANVNQYIILNLNAGSIQTTGSGANSQTFTSPLALRGSNTITSDYTDASKTLTLGNLFGNYNGANTLTLNGSNKGANNVAGGIYKGAGSGSISVVKDGTGTWILSGTNAYDGTTQVKNGALMVTGTHTGGGAYTVDGGVLGGAGGKISASGVTITAAAGSGINVSGAGLGTTGSQNALTGPGILELDLGVGTLDISNAGANSLTFVLATPELSDQVKLSSGTLNIGSGTVDLSTFNFDITNWSGNGIYTLFSTSSANGIVGSLGSNLTGILNGHNVSLLVGEDTSGFQTLQLVVVPEPSTLGAIGVGLLVLAGAGLHRRRILG